MKPKTYYKSLAFMMGSWIIPKGQILISEDWNVVLCGIPLSPNSGNQLFEEAPDYVPNKEDVELSLKINS